MYVHWCIELCICTHIYIHFCIICVHTFDVSKSCSVAATALSLFYYKNFRSLSEFFYLTPKNVHK